LFLGRSEAEALGYFLPARPRWRDRERERAVLNTGAFGAKEKEIIVTATTFGHRAPAARSVRLLASKGSRRRCQWLWENGPARGGKRRGGGVEREPGKVLRPRFEPVTQQPCFFCSLHRGKGDRGACSRPCPVDRAVRGAIGTLATSSINVCKYQALAAHKLNGVTQSHAGRHCDLCRRPRPRQWARATAADGLLVGMSKLSRHSLRGTTRRQTRQTNPKIKCALAGFSLPSDTGENGRVRGQGTG